LTKADTTTIYLLNPKLGILQFVWPTPVERYARKERLFAEGIDKLEAELKKEVNHDRMEELSKGYRGIIRLTTRVYEECSMQKELDKAKEEEFQKEVDDLLRGLV
jgi:hypothetical protein